MSLFDDMLKGEESVFVDEVSLDYEYLPRNLPHRENQQQYLATCIKPLLQNRNGKNLLITGQPGIGKTAAARFVLRELEDKGLDDTVYLIYINCWKKDTSHKAILDICNQIGYKFTHNKTTDELIKIAAKIINKKTAAFILDEADKLTDFDFLYSLLEDIYKKSIFLITNEKSFLASLDKRISSRLLPELLEFKPYNLEETKNVLKHRRDYAFVKNTWDEKAFTLIAEKTTALKDIRAGLFLLRESGLEAEAKASKKITEDHAERAIEKLKDFTIKSSQALEKEDSIILDLIKEHSGKTSKEVYTIYKEKTGKSYKTFYRKFKELEKNKFISTTIKVAEDGTNILVLKYAA